MGTTATVDPTAAMSAFARSYSFGFLLPWSRIFRRMARRIAFLLQSSVPHHLSPTRAHRYSCRRYSHSSHSPIMLGSPLSPYVILTLNVDFTKHLFSCWNRGTRSELRGVFYAKDP